MAAADDAGNAVQHPELDVEKLHSLPSEQQNLYLLSYASDLSRHVANLDSDGATAEQLYIKKEVFKVLHLSSPAPTRVIRNNLGRCLAGIFAKGDRKLLFETINELVQLLTVAKGDKDFYGRHAALHCLGAVLEVAGDSAVSLSANACVVMLRTLKNAQYHTSVRASAIRSLGRVVKGVRQSIDEAVLRDIWKQARQLALGDKSLLVQANACWCMQQLFEHVPYMDNSSEFERLQVIIWKAMESHSPTVRRAASVCLATVLVKSYSAVPNPVSRVKRSKKSTAKAAAEEAAEDDGERPSSPVQQKPITSISLSLLEILRILSGQYCRPSVSNRAKAAVASCYTRTLRGLDEQVIEAQYAVIARHFYEDVLSASNITVNRYRLLVARKFVRLILGRVVCLQILGEAGQLKALNWVVNSVLRDYPQSDVRERPEPSKEALIAALDTLTTLTSALGSAVSSSSDGCRDSILQVLQHPSYTVQIHASRSFQALVLACPHQLIPVVTICMNSVNREVAQLSSLRRSPRRCLGFAHGLAAAVSTSSSQPLYGSVDVYARVFSQATAILKSSSSSDLKVSSAQIQVAWILIGGLMALGPNFVKIHLSQLLLLWKNALPKPLSKDNIGQRGLLELSFLAHVRECALGSIRAFLVFNHRLLTVDISKRLSAMLQNTISFLSNLPPRKTTDDREKRLSPALQLQDYEALVKRRVFECYTALINSSPSGSQDSLLQSGMLSIAISTFADPNTESAGSLSSTIAASTANFENIWELGDNSGFGLTGLVHDVEFDGSLLHDSSRHQFPPPRGGVEEEFDRTVRSPVCGDLEHDAVLLYTTFDAPPPLPLGTEVIDVAIRLFAISLPLQSTKIQEGALEQISSLLASCNAEEMPAKSVAIHLNVSAALFHLLQHGAKESGGGTGRLVGNDLEKAMQELLHGFITNSEPSIRQLAAESLGRLCKIAGTEFISKEINLLIDMIVASREPQARAGCATALGCIHSELGGMAAGFHMKNILSILTSLANDQHPTVHYWALEALSRVIESAGLAFSGYVTNTLGLVSQLYYLDSHNDEVSTLSASNLQLDLPAPTVVAKCIKALINVLGPDLQDMTKQRNLILTMTYQFQTESSNHLGVLSLKCLELMSFYAPGHISFSPYVRQLQSKLTSQAPGVQEAAMTGLYNAMRRGAEEVVGTADYAFQDKLWLALDQSYGSGTMRELVLDWVEQSGMLKAEVWIQRVQAIVTKIRPVRAPQKSVDKAQTPVEPDLQDEEVAGFNAAGRQDKAEKEQGGDAVQELLRWQTRCVALDSLLHILSKVAHEVLTQEDSPVALVLQARIADVVRIAFSSSTAAVVEVRTRGIQIIGKVLQIFGKVPDPDFPEATLLEQYQAQISSALTPAFATDSSPILAAEAIGVCAAFVSTGIVTDVERMGRILKLLVSALDDFARDSNVTQIGDLKGLSSNAQTMVKLATFSAWAQLQIASLDQKYLKDVVSPYLKTLTPLWLVCLREYARLKFEPDISTSASSSVTGNLDTLYAALNRETLLRFYQASWLHFVDAIASLIDEDSDFVFNALDEKDEPLGNGEKTSAGSKSHDINYRDEPVAFFFVLFGISFEALLASSSLQTRQGHETTLEILKAMKRILLPSVAGLAVYQNAIFSELMDVLDRLILTEGVEVQTIIVEIARNLCLNHPSARRTDRSVPDDDSLSEDIDQLFELTRLIVLVISNYMPAMTQGEGRPQAVLKDETVVLITLALEALVDSAEIFPSIIKSDLHACILHVFATILSNGFSQEVLVPQALPILKRFVTSLSKHPQPETVSQLRNSMTRFGAIIKNAQKREVDAAVLCERNTLLAATMLLTTTAKLFSAEDPLLGAFVSNLVECLGNRMTTTVAAGLSRSLLLLPTSSGANKARVQASSSESALSAMILPHLVDFVANPLSIEGTANSRNMVSQSLTTFSLGLPAPSQQRTAAVTVTLTALLKRASEEGESVWQEVSTRLVELVRGEAEGCKEAVASMSQEQKQLMEDVIRAGAAARANDKNGEADEADFASAREPTIALRMDF